MNSHKESVKRGLRAGFAWGFFLVFAGISLVYISENGLPKKTVSSLSAQSVPAKQESPVAYTPTVTQKVATEAPWYDVDGDKLRGTVVSVVGSRVTLNLLNNVRVDGKGIKIQAKSDTIAYGEGTDKVYIDVQEEDQGKVLINIDGQGYRADQQTKIFWSLANLTPGTWCCFIWVRPEGTTETLKLRYISLLKDGIAAN